MGNSDKWTTPKQIKIERDGEPRGVRRGRLKKGERKKGKKARWDEVEAAYKNRQLYQRWYEASIQEDHKYGLCRAERYKKYATDARIKHSQLREAYNRDYGPRES